MRAEKQFLIDEVGAHLDKSNYVYFADFERITVAETEELRRILAEQGAEFHVVKNSVLQRAGQDRGLPGMEDRITGPTAIVIGGENPPGVAKILEKFLKDKKKMEIKGGFLEKGRLSAEDVFQLAKLPSQDVLRAQLLSLLNTPATQLARVLIAGPQGFLNVLQAKVDKEKED